MFLDGVLDSQSESSDECSAQGRRNEYFMDRNLMHVVQELTNAMATVIMWQTAPPKLACMMHVYHRRANGNTPIIHQFTEQRSTSKDCIHGNESVLP
jgi:hypothetical protein